MKIVLQIKWGLIRDGKSKKEEHELLLDCVDRATSIGGTRSGLSGSIENDSSKKYETELSIM